LDFFSRICVEAANLSVAIVKVQRHLICGEKINKILPLFVSR